MKITFLGTGGSFGIPEIGCQCKVCQSTNPKDKRTRSSVLIEEDDTRILIDCGPDFRQQILQQPFRKLDAVLLTHEHYDHVSGIDDLRAFGKFGAINIYTNQATEEALKRRMPYCFGNHRYPGVPELNLQAIDAPFMVNWMKIEPVTVMHYKLPIYGYRINNFAYLTDVKYIPEEEFSKLENLDTLVISALRHEPHVAHQTLEEALEVIARIAPRRAYLIHMAHSLGLHDEENAKLPENVYLPYDGLEVEVVG